MTSPLLRINSYHRGGGEACWDSDLTQFKKMANALSREAPGKNCYQYFSRYETPIYSSNKHLANTITKSLLSRLDAFEMWVYRRVLKISWTEERITNDCNEEVLRRMGTDREIVRQFKTRKLQYLGHLIRHNSTQLQLIEGKIEGRRSRGRPRNTWTTDITTTKGLKYYQLKRAAEDRKRWHGLVVNLAQETTLR